MLQRKVELEGEGFLGFAAFTGLLFLLVAATIALANIVAPWLAALIVGLVVTAIGVALLAKGRSSISSTNLVPERTVHSVQKDVSSPSRRCGDDRRKKPVRRGHRARA